MNRRNMTLLSVGIALLVVAAVAVNFFLTSQQSDPPPSIQPPPRQSHNVGDPDSFPDPIVSFAPYTPLEPDPTDPDDARRLIHMLNRPQDYTCRLQAVWFWPGGQSLEQYTLAVRGEAFAITEADSGGAVRRRFLGDGERFLCWTQDDSVYYEGALGSATLDDLCAIPTYEELLELPDGVIYNYGYETDEQGRRVLTVYTRDELYVGQYVLDVDIGLLLQAYLFSAQDETELVYRMDMLEFSPETPGDELFIPPGEVTAP